MAMESGSLIVLCLAALFACVVVPWSLVVVYRRQRTSNTPRKSKSVVENANNYRRYREYTGLILCWAVTISVYIAILSVLDHAVNHFIFMGPKGSNSRNVNFQVLSFVWTGFAIIHYLL